MTIVIKYKPQVFSGDVDESLNLTFGWLTNSWLSHDRPRDYSRAAGVTHKHKNSMNVTHRGRSCQGFKQK